MTREEAIKELRGFLGQLTEGCQEVIKVLIPELKEKESEDERIRKELAEFINHYRYNNDLTSEQAEWCHKALTWIEKQKYDRMKPIYDARESFESALEKAWNDYHNGYENVDKLEDDYVECAHAKGFREGYLFGIEKQKDNKFAPRVLPCSAAWFEDGEENQEEQKPILEVFGFKVGDKVRLKDGDGRVHIIKKFEKIEGIHGPDFYQVEFEDNSARDGIYPGEEYPNGYYTQMEKIEEEQNECPEYCIRSHCIGCSIYEKQKEQKPVEIDEEINRWMGCEAFPEGTNITPLPQAIEIVERTAKYFFELGEKTVPSPGGYWEGFNHGVRECQDKIRDVKDTMKEQKPSEWSEDFEENIRNLLHDKLTGHSEDGTMTWTTFIDDKTLRDIVSGIWFYVGKEALKYPNKELNVADWSEEDEDMIDLLIKVLEVNHPNGHFKANEINTIDMRVVSTQEFVAWLKSLRPQPKEEWSEEDEEKRDDIVKIIEYSTTIPAYGKTGILKLSKEYKKELTVWLKSLRPQPKEEWSDDDEHRRNDAVYFLETAKKHYADTSEIELTIDWLKSLRPQAKKKCSEKPKHTEVWVEGRTIFEQDANTFVNTEGEPEAKLTGWVARDREYNPYFGLGLVIFNGKPKRTGNCWSGEIASQLPWKLFPDLKWEDEPVEVEITIRRK